MLTSLKSFSSHLEGMITVTLTIKMHLRLLKTPTKLLPKHLHFCQSCANLRKTPEVSLVQIHEGFGKRHRLRPKHLLVPKEDLPKLPDLCPVQLWYPRFILSAARGAVVD